MDVFWCKPLPQSVRQEHLGYVGSESQEQGQPEDDDPLPQGVVNKSGSGGKPEDDNARIENIHQHSGGKNFGVVTFAEQDQLVSFGINLYFFKEQKIDAHHNHKDAAGYAYGLPVL